VSDLSSVLQIWSANSCNYSSCTL